MRPKSFAGVTSTSTAPMRLPVTATGIQRSWVSVTEEVGAGSYRRADSRAEHGHRTRYFGGEGRDAAGEEERIANERGDAAGRAYDAGDRATGGEHNQVKGRHRPSQVACTPGASNTCSPLLRGRNRRQPGAPLLLDASVTPDQYRQCPRRDEDPDHEITRVLEVAQRADQIPDTAVQVQLVGE